MTNAEARLLIALLPKNGAEPVAMTLRQLGGQRGSTHSVLAQRTEAKGWITRERRGGGDVRPAYALKITTAGAQALANHMAILRQVRESTT